MALTTELNHYSNGGVPNGLKNGASSISTKLSQHASGTGCPLNATGIMRSTIPCLLFLSVYGLNGRIRILPRAADAQCVQLHNISALEYHIFGSSPPHLIISSMHNHFFDLLSALPYLMHYLIPVLYPIYLYTFNKVEHISRFLWLLGWSMWAHYVIWFLLPTAPPWVYDNLDQFRRANISPPPMHLQHREGCAFARLDSWTGLPFFFSIFSGNPVPFASFPSGHVSWPTCILISLPHSHRTRRYFALYIVWVAWATMYSCHHYLTDIIAAILVVMATDRSIVFWNRRKITNRLRMSDDSLTAVFAQ